MKNPLTLAILWLIRLYQHTLSPDLGWFKAFYPQGYCPYHPHCSEYCYQAIERYGCLTGLWYSFRRILRCHPWAQGGADPLP